MTHDDMIAASTSLARPPAIEDPSNRWLIHPVAERLLAPAIRLGIAPNSVSFTGLAFGVASGIAYAHWQDPGMPFLGLALMLCWHVCDGLDGKLARATGRTSPLGRLIDGLCDYLVFFAVLLPIALGYDDWRLLLLCLVAGVFHAVQSAWYEGEREAWRRRLQGQFAPVPRPVTRSMLERPYNWVEARLGSGMRPIDQALARRPGLLPAYLEASAPLVRTMSVAGANGRTFGIFIAASAGLPWTYWVWEIVGVTTLAVALAIMLRRREEAIAAMA